METMPRNFWERLDRYPPILVRLLATDDKGEPLSSQSIAQAARMEVYQVDSLASETSWYLVTIGMAKRYLKACRVDLADPRQMKRIDVYLRGKKNGDGSRRPPCFRYLRLSPDWEHYYLPLMNRYRESLLLKGPQ